MAGTLPGVFAVTLGGFFCGLNHKNLGNYTADIMLGAHISEHLFENTMKKYPAVCLHVKYTEKKRGGGGEGRSG